MTKKDNNKTNEIILNITSLLDIPEDQVEISTHDNGIDVKLDIPEEESGMFIGHQGETLNSLQLLISLVVSERLGDWTRVKVTVGDYRERREEALRNKADQAADRALETGMEIIIPNLNSFERHLIHEHFQDRTDVTTESRGNPPFRHLYVIPSLTS